MYNNSEVLHEILNDQWAMSFSHLARIRHFMENVVASGKEGQRKPVEPHKALSFFNDDFVRINPSSAAEIPEGTTAVVKAIGPMMKYGSWWFQGADEVVAQLDFANDLQNVSATVLKTDGPGGAVGAIPAFIDFAERKRKPIVASCDQSLSLHRWIPDAVADYQMADNDIVSRFGSIGVMSSWMDLSKYYEDLKIILEEVYPEESNHKNEIHRIYKEDPEKARKMLREMHLTPMAQKFQAAVKAAHPNLIEEEGVLSGRTFTGADAVRINMIDKVGNLKQAMVVAQALAENSSIN